MSKRVTFALTLMYLMLGLEAALYKTTKQNVHPAIIPHNRNAFDALLPAFAAAWQAQVGQRAPGGGQADKARFSSIQEKVFYVLFYFKCYPTFDVARFLFDFDRSQANRWMHRLQPIQKFLFRNKSNLHNYGLNR